MESLEAYADEHEVKSSQNYDPYDYIYEQEYYYDPLVEILEDFDWEHDE